MRLNPFARNLLIIAAVAALIVVLNQETALSTAGALLRVAFFVAVAVVVYFYWRDFGRRQIGLWATRTQIVFYAAAALLVADLAYWFTASPGGRDALAAIVVGAICVYSAVRTWRTHGF